MKILREEDGLSWRGTLCKQKLAMQQLIDWLNKNSIPKNELQMKEFDEELTRLLLVNKAQAIQAYNKGMTEVFADGNTDNFGEQYFQNSYE